MMNTTTFQSESDSQSQDAKTEEEISDLGELLGRGVNDVTVGRGE